MKWEGILVYAFAQDLGRGKWQWVANYDGHDYADFRGINELMYVAGQDGWELATVMPLNWEGGETKAFQMFFKRQSA